MFLGIDLANFYLNTPMADPEYMRLRLDIIPEEIIIKYNLRDRVDEEGWVYVEICKGMYGLPQAGIIANQLLEKRRPKRVTTSANTLQASGVTSGAVSCSALLLMTSG